MKPELKTLITIHRNFGSVVELVEASRGGRSTAHGWREQPSDGEIADWILFQSWRDRDGSPYWHLVASQAWREYYDSLSEVEQMMHLSDEDDDDWVDPQCWLCTKECDYPVDQIIPDHLRWKERAAPAVLEA
jgi:hypothetical protein